MKESIDYPLPSSAVSEEIEALGKECEKYQPVVQSIFDEVKRILENHRFLNGEKP